MATALSSLVGAKELNDLRESLPRLFCQKYYNTRLPIRQRLSQRLHRSPKNKSKYLKYRKVRQPPEQQLECPKCFAPAKGVPVTTLSILKAAGSLRLHEVGTDGRLAPQWCTLQLKLTPLREERHRLSLAKHRPSHPKPLYTRTPHCNYETANSGKLASHHKGHYIAPEKLKLTTAAGSDEPPALSVATSVQLLVVWLYLYAGISRNAANIVLRVVRLILNDALVRLSATPPSPAKIPGDIRTAIKKLAITPEMHRRLCCS